MATNPVLAIIEGDLLNAAGSPLLTFLAQFAAAAGDPAKVTAAVVQLEGALVGALPGLEGTLAQQIAAALTAKLQQALSNVPKPA
jgi:hypothetical protein